MQSARWIVRVLFVSTALLANNTAIGLSGRFQDDKSDAQKLAALQAELEAVRADQVRKRDEIAVLTAQAEAAKQATRVTELQAKKIIQYAEARLQAAEARAKEVSQDRANDASVVQGQKMSQSDLAAAQSQHLAAMDYFTRVQAETKQAQDMYRALTDVQANTALQDFVVGRVSGYGNSADQSQDFWIGVQCEPSAEVQVRMDQSSDRLVTLKGGLRINAVTAESPAQTAGIVEQDVILFMNDRATNQIEELVAAIDENGEKPATLQIVREHNPMTLSITPLKRPQGETLKEGVDFTGVDLNVNPQWLRYHGVPAVYGSAELPKLPSGFEANVHFVGGEQPEFKIKSSDQSWTVTGENIDQLPEEVRPFAQHVLGMLSSGQTSNWRAVPDQYYNNAVEGLKSPTLRYVPTLGVYARRADLAAEVDGPAIDGKLDQLQKQVNELREMIERLEK